MGIYQNKGKSMKTVLVVPDLHCPYQDQQAVETVLKINKYVKPDVTVLLGDVIEAEGVSKYIKESVAARAISDLGKEFDSFNALFDKLTTYSSEVLITKGNHCARLLEYADQHPEVSSLVNFEKNIYLKERRKAGKRIRICEYNEALNIGKLWFTHGTYTGDNAAKKMVMAYQRSIIFGHTHSVSCASWVSPIDVRDKHTAYNLGCLCSQNPGFMKNKPNAWSHACGIAYVQDNGCFNFYTIGIFDGVAVFNGKVFSS